MHPIRIDDSSLFARVCRYWLNASGQLPVQLDICTVRKIVLFKAPWHWFWNQKIVGGICPWMIVVFTTAVATTTLAVAKVTWALMLWFWIGIMLAFLAGAIAVAFGLMLAMVCIYGYMILPFSHWLAWTWNRSFAQAACHWFFSRRIGWFWLWTAIPYATLLIIAIGNLVYDRTAPGITVAIACLIIVWSITYTSRAYLLDCLDHLSDPLTQPEKAGFCALAAGVKAPFALTLGTFGVIKLIYRSLKDRFCLPVEFVDKAGEVVKL